MRAFILSGREYIYKGEAKEVVMPGRDGEFSVLDFHQPFLYRLRRGLIKLREKKEHTPEQIFAISDGIASFNENSLLILCEKR